VYMYFTRLLLLLIQVSHCFSFCHVMTHIFEQEFMHILERGFLVVLDKLSINVRLNDCM